MNDYQRRSSKLSWLLNVLAFLLERWPLVLIAVFFLTPQGPHLRVSYAYYGTYEHPTYTSCTYLGSRGFREAYGPDCPVVLWLDVAEFN